VPVQLDKLCWKIAADLTFTSCFFSTPLSLSLSLFGVKHTDFERVLRENEGGKNKALKTGAS